MRMAPALGCSKPATMRSVVVLPQPLGPRNETNSPRSTASSKFCTTFDGPKDLRRSLISRNAIPSPAVAGALACVRRQAGAASEHLDQPHAGPGDDEGDDGESRRFVGAVGADELQIRAESRPIEQARHGEFADDYGEGEEGAAQHGHANIREKDAE